MSPESKNEQPSHWSLSTLAPTPGARHRRKRKGLGESSGSGKTSGRGNKGYKSRSGCAVNRGFEGGQMPLHRRLPKSGFTSRKKVLGENDYTVVSIERLSTFAEGEVITLAALRAAGILRGKNRRLKILGGGNAGKFVVEAHAVSASARKAIETAGGEVRLV